MRKYFHKILVVAVAVVLTTSCVAQQKATPAKAAAAMDTRAADEKAIRAEAEAWSKSAGAKDADNFVSFYSPDANVFPSNEPLTTGKAKILAYWKKFLATPGMAMTFGPTRVEVAKSGDMAYETGTYKVTMNDAKGKPSTELGKYVVVWKKQPDGKWKAAADIFNPDK